MSTKNAKTLPKVLYGLHFVEGVAEYEEPEVNNGKPYRLLINNDVMNQMNPGFSGKPVYVRHVNEVNLDKLQEEADGYVVESFFNKPDGRHWVQFMVVSDKGHEAISKGWKLSNSYVMKESGGGGTWHAVDYLKSVKRADFEHLAIVPNPRYEESKILTPEQFKQYNSEKELELRRMTNSKGDKPMASILNLFKKSKVDNAADLEGVCVTLKSGTEKTFIQLVNEAEEKEAKEKKDDADAEAGKHPMANAEHMVKIGEEHMNVAGLVDKYNALVAEHKALMEKHKDDDAEEGKEKEEPVHDEDAPEHEKKEPEEKKDDKKSNEADKKKKQENFDKIANAHLNAADGLHTVDLSADKVARGKSRYGSK